MLHPASSAALHWNQERADTINVDQAAGLIGGKNFRRWIKKMDFRENDINKYVYEDRTK